MALLARTGSQKGSTSKGPGPSLLSLLITTVLGFPEPKVVSLVALNGFVFLEFFSFFLAPALPFISPHPMSAEGPNPAEHPCICTGYSNVTVSWGCRGSRQQTPAPTPPLLMLCTHVGGWKSTMFTVPSNSATVQFGEGGCAAGTELQHLENEAKLCPGAGWGGAQNHFRSVRGAADGAWEETGRAHPTCRQEEAAKISRRVEKGGESIKEITERLEGKVRGSEPKAAECHGEVKLSLTSSTEHRDEETDTK